MKYQVILDYTIASGDLTPYFNALLAGRALASTCTSCRHVAFPARTTCQRCAGREFDWTELQGTASVLFRTDGQAGSFALVRFDGADTNSTVALGNPEACNSEAPELNEECLPQASPNAQTLRGRLIVPPGELPGLWLVLTTNNDEITDEH